MVATVRTLWVANCGNTLARRLQQSVRAGQIGNIGGGLACEHRIVQPELLRELDLAVPVGALDQSDHPPAPRVLGQCDQPVDDLDRTLLISLDREAQPVPIVQRGVARERGEQLQRQHQTVGFFRVDRQADVRLRRFQRQLAQAWQELSHHARCAAPAHSADAMPKA